MRECANGVWQLSGFPPNAINVYLAGDVLVDAATKLARRRILRQLRGRPVSLHVLTHAHPDHQGASKAVCDAYGIELWCGERDVAAMEAGPEGVSAATPPGIVNFVQKHVWSGPAHPVARGLREGDTVGDFTVLDVPGHSAGHVAYWRESDRVLILGDVYNNMDVRTGRVGLHAPLDIFTPDPALNRESMRRLAALRPAVALFGHGPRLRDPGVLQEFADRLPA